MTDQPRFVAVFGSSLAQPGDDLYEQGMLCGGLLARAGFGVVTGGYGGLMEAVSRGARESGGSALGITAPEIFKNRSGPNEYVTEEWRAAHLMERIHELTDVSVASISLPGSVGTMAELAAAWNLAFISRYSGATPKQVITVGERWRELVDFLAETLSTDRSLVETVETVEQAVDTIIRAVE